MKIKELYQPSQIVFSFEFFPPKNDKGESALFEAIENLKSLSPGYVTVTYGAMGNTRDNTLKIVKRIKNEFHMETAAHLTCIAHTREEIKNILAELKENGIENIVALRGDTPKDAPLAPGKQDFHYAAELVDFIRRDSGLGSAFTLAVAGYPETHVECKDKSQDLLHLKQKVDAGADLIITQLFFDNNVFFDFTERARAAGIKVPIVAGIMPITNGSQIQRFSEMCGASIPDEMRQAITRHGDNQAAIEDFGIDYATRQCAELLRKGVAGIHFYTLNRSRATFQIYQNLGLKK